MLATGVKEATDLAESRPRERRERRFRMRGGPRTRDIIRLVPQRSRAKAWVLVLLILLLAVVGSVSYLGWRQTVPGVQALSAPPRFLGLKTPLTVVLEARRGNVTRVEIRVAQSGTSATVVKQEGALGRRVEIPVVVESGAWLLASWVPHPILLGLGFAYLGSFALGVGALYGSIPLVVAWRRRALREWA